MFCSLKTLKPKNVRRVEDRRLQHSFLEMRTPTPGDLVLGLKRKRISSSHKG